MLLRASCRERLALCPFRGRGGRDSTADEPDSELGRVEQEPILQPRHFSFFTITLPVEMARTAGVARLSVFTTSMVLISTSGRGFGACML